MGPNLEADGGSDLELANGLKEPDLIPAKSSTPKPPIVSDASSSGLEMISFFAFLQYLKVTSTAQVSVFSFSAMIDGLGFHF